MDCFNIVVGNVVFDLGLVGVCFRFVGVVVVVEYFSDGVVVE